jgi:hypothetical protein
MDPNNSLGGNINPQQNQQNPYLPLGHQDSVNQPLPHQPAQGSSLKRQITDQLVAPSDILEYDRPNKRVKEYTSRGMDKRHPSSFQQLEKVWKYLFANDELF